MTEEPISKIDEAMIVAYAESLMQGIQNAMEAEARKPYAGLHWTDKVTAGNVILSRLLLEQLIADVSHRSDSLPTFDELMRFGAHVVEIMRAHLETEKDAVKRPPYLRLVKP